jgi:hypothetical protein
VAVIPAVINLRALGFVLLCIATNGCGTAGPEPQELRYVDWHSVAWSGGTTNLAVLAPQELEEVCTP